METAAIVKLVEIILPIAVKGGIDLVQIIQRLKEGRTTESIIAELESKRDDLPNLSFGQP